jgi:hypothetical protein
MYSSGGQQIEKRSRLKYMYAVSNLKIVFHLSAQPI